MRRIIGDAEPITISTVANGFMVAVPFEPAPRKSRHDRTGALIQLIRKGIGEATAGAEPLDVMNNIFGEFEKMHNEVQEEDFLAASLDDELGNPDSRIYIFKTFPEVLKFLEGRHNQKVAASSEAAKSKRPGQRKK